jgi:hypothetical protein
MRSPLLLAMGLGPRCDFEEGALREVAESATAKLLGLRSGVAGIALPGEAVLRLDAARATEVAIEGVARALFERPTALRLRLVVLPDEARQVRSGLLETASRLSDSRLSIRLDRFPRVPPDRRAPPAPRAEPPAGEPAPRPDPPRQP